MSGSHQRKWEYIYIYIRKSKTRLNPTPLLRLYIMQALWGSRAKALLMA